MIAGLGGLEGLKKEAQQTFVQHLARRVTHALDGMAGSRALSDAERVIQEVCRDRFTLYDPTCDRQVGFVKALEELADSAPGCVEESGNASRPDEDRLMAALLGSETQPTTARHPDRHDQPSRRDSCRRSRDEWSDYLGKWRRGAA